jgi:hypothetical protein
VPNRATIAVNYRLPATVDPERQVTFGGMQATTGQRSGEAWVNRWPQVYPQRPAAGSVVFMIISQIPPCVWNMADDEFRRLTT